MPEITAATIRIMIMGSASSSKKRLTREVFFPSFSLFRPNFSSRPAASPLVRPSGDEFCSFSTSSTLVKYSFTFCASFKLCVKKDDKFVTVQ